MKYVKYKLRTANGKEFIIEMHKKEWSEKIFQLIKSIVGIDDLKNILKIKKDGKRLVGDLLIKKKIVCSILWHYRCSYFDEIAKYGIQRLDVYHHAFSKVDIEKIANRYIALIDNALLVEVLGLENNDDVYLVDNKVAAIIEKSIERGTLKIYDDVRKMIIEYEIAKRKERPTQIVTKP